jgi:hypothetical protein
LWICSRKACSSAGFCAADRAGKTPAAQARRTLLPSPSGRTDEGEPKTARGRRSVALDGGTVRALRDWRKRQLEERLAWEPA